MSKKIEIVKSLDKGITIEDIKNRKNSVNFCSWERLKPFLTMASGADHRGDNVIGIIASEEGIEIFLKNPNY